MQETFNSDSNKILSNRMKMLLEKKSGSYELFLHPPSTCFKMGGDQQSAVKLICDKSNPLFFGKVSKKCFGEERSP